MPTDTFTEMINAVIKKDPLFTVGTVKTVDEAEMTCTVTPEDGGQDIEDVPLRIMRYADSVGFTAVPVLNTEAIVLWLGPQRPVIFRVHEWDKVIIQNKDGHGVIVKKGGVLLGLEAGATHPVAWGDVIATYLAQIQVEVNLLGGALAAPPTVSSAEVKTS